jgi:hypothetical protein
MSPTTPAKFSFPSPTHTEIPDTKTTYRQKPNLHIPLGYHFEDGRMVWNQELSPSWRSISGLDPTSTRAQYPSTEKIRGGTMYLSVATLRTRITLAITCRISSGLLVLNRVFMGSVSNTRYHSGVCQWGGPGESRYYWGFSWPLVMG